MCALFTVDGGFGGRTIRVVACLSWAITPATAPGAGAPCVACSRCSDSCRRNGQQHRCVIPQVPGPEFIESRQVFEDRLKQRALLGQRQVLQTQRLKTQYQPGKGGGTRTWLGGKHLDPMLLAEIAQQPKAGEQPGKDSHSCSAQVSHTATRTSFECSRNRHSLISRTFCQSGWRVPCIDCNLASSDSSASYSLRITHITAGKTRLRAR